jgi:DNA-binding NarL/FixJ family response regulator
LDLAVGQSFLAARTMLCQGERRRREGQRIAARERLDQAMDVFSRVEADPWMRRAEAELAATGASSTKALLPAIAPTLTNQELQIATLVAEGHRNSEIAAALYLSTKTVEFHLTRAYRKAGVSNRTQLASVIAQRPT